MTRDERQDLMISRWKENKGIGTCVGCTGFGKTRVGMKICDLVLQQNQNRSVLIVVPSIHLKNNWEDQIEYFGLKDYCIKVEVINTVAKLRDQKYDLLILDECHRYSTEKTSDFSFSNIFDKECLQYRFILALTATVERSDKNESLLLSFAPIVDVVTLTEATQNGWVSKYKNYILSCDFTNKDRLEYEKIDEEYDNVFAFFSNDYNAARNCLTNKVYAKNYYINNIARPEDLQNEIITVDHPEVKKVIGLAVKFQRLVAKRKDLIYNHVNKKIMAEQLSQELISLNKQFICFSQNIEFTDYLNSKFPESTISYHSKIKSSDVPIINNKKLSVKAYKEFLLNQIKRKEKLGIYTPVSLDEGADIPDLSIAIICSYTSQKRQGTQRIGRVIRANGDSEKVAIVINMVTPRTQEEVWFKKGYGENVGSEFTRVDSVQTLINILKHDGILKP